MVQSTTSGPPRSDRSVAVGKKREILAAASRVFRRQGLHATGMRDIAAEAGMRVGNLYYYFKSKGELLAFCQLETLAALLALASWVEEQQLPAGEQLYLLVMGHVVSLNESTPGSLAHLEIEALEEPWLSEILERRREYEDVFRDVIRQGTKAGTFRPCDERLAVRAILGAVNWTVKWFRPEGTMSARQIGALFAEQMVRGLVSDFQPPELELPSLEVLAGQS